MFGSIYVLSGVHELWYKILRPKNKVWIICIYIACNFLIKFAESVRLIDFTLFCNNWFKLLQKLLYYI